MKLRPLPAEETEEVMFYDPAATGERIQNLRKNREVTQEQLAIEPLCGAAGAIWLLAGLHRLRCVCVPAGAGTARSAANAPQRTERNAAADSCYAGNAG